MNSLTPGQRLRKWRDDNNYSSTYIAEKLNVSNPTITRFEKGQTQLTADTLRKLNETFDLSIDWILTGIYKEPENITDDQKTLLALYNELTEEQQRIILSTAKNFAKGNNNEKPELKYTDSRKVS